MNLKAAAREHFDAVRPAIVDLSHRIHANPELGFEERLASQWLCELLADAGFEVEAGACNLPTAFIARAGSGPLHLALCAEYDSLPGLGHACGHNIIAAAAAGAGIAASKVADEARFEPEHNRHAGRGSRQRERQDSAPGPGGFAGVHAAAMVHPAPVDMATPQMLATSVFEVRYRGREEYVCAHPHKAVNAADAMTVAQTAIGLMRQQIRPTDRVHGIITGGGYDRNFVPALTSARYMVRASTVRHLDEIRGKVQRCFEAGAIATGAELEIVGGDRPYAEMIHDPDMIMLYQRNAESLGRLFFSMEGMDRPVASTDMGNVSLRIPSIHPMIGIDSLPAMNHQPQFAPCCVTERADQAVIDGSLAMAWTLIDMALEPKLRERLLHPGLAERAPSAGAWLE